MIEKTLTISVDEQSNDWIKQQIDAGEFPDEASLISESVVAHQSYNKLSYWIESDKQGQALRQEALEASVMEGQSSNGLITIKMSCDFQVNEVMIDPGLALPTAPEDLAEAISEALANALHVVHLVRDHSGDPEFL